MKNKLATIELISEIKEHPNADRLELVKILGFQLICQKGVHKIGNKVCFVRTDTVLPNHEWAESFKKYSPNRVRAFNMRGEFTEGIAIPLHEMIKYYPNEISNDIKVGTDVSDIIGVIKFEYKEPQHPHAKSTKLPYFISPTDEIRWENSESLPYGEKVDIFIKVDGTSMTNVYNSETDEYHICARNQEMLLDKDNEYTKISKNYNIEKLLKTYVINNNLINFALRGEIYGKGVSKGSKNPHLNLETNVAFFSSYDVKRKKYFYKGSEHYFLNVCRELELPIVDLLEEDVILTEELIQKYSNLEKLNGKMFEGVVVQHSNGSFKIINKYYDSKK